MHSASRSTDPLSITRAPTPKANLNAPREEWLQPWAKAATLAAMRRLQLSLSPNLAGHFFDAAQIKAPWEHALTPSGTPGLRAQPKAAPAATTRRQRKEPPAPVLWPCHLRRKGVEPKCEADALCHWERSPRGRGRCVASTPAGAQTS